LEEMASAYAADGSMSQWNRTLLLASATPEVNTKGKGVPTRGKKPGRENMVRQTSAFLRRR